MKYTLLFYVVILIAYNITLNAQPWTPATTFWNGQADQCPPGEYHLVFRDEFNGIEVDENKWDLGRPATYPFNLFQFDSVSDCNFSEGALYKWENINIINQEYLQISVNSGPETYTWTPAQTDTVAGCILEQGVPITREFGFSSASLCSKNGWNFGKFEARCRIPKNIQGTWPAFWLWHFDEIDIFEFFGVNTEFYSTIHQNTTFSYTMNSSGPKTGLDFTDWHIYSVEWTPYEINFSIDGNVYHSLIKYDPVDGETFTFYLDNIDCGDSFNSGQYHTNMAFPLDNVPLVEEVWPNLLLGSGIFSTLPNISDYTFPINFDIDYVRVYQRTEVWDPNNICIAQLDPFPDDTRLCIGDEFVFNVTFNPDHPQVVPLFSTTYGLSIVDSGPWGVKVRANGGISPTGNALVTATISGSEGCPAQTITRNISVGLPPRPAFSQPEVICEGNKTRVFVDITQPVDGVDYEWNFGGGAQVINNYGGHYVHLSVPTTNAVIPVIVTATNECGTNVFYDYIDIDCEGANHPQKISVSPNPSYGDVVVKFENFDDSVFQDKTAPIYIYDNSMSLVKTYEQANMEQTVHLFEARNGLHYIFTNIEGKVYTAQFMIDRE